MRHTIIITAILMLSGCATSPYVSEYVRARNEAALAEIENLPDTLREGLIANRISAVKNRNGDYLLGSRFPEYQDEIANYHVNLLEKFFERDKTPENIEQLVRAGKIGIGMSSAQVVTAWGDPSDVNSTLTASGKSEQWIYGNSYTNRKYIYFDNGILTAIQD